MWSPAVARALALLDLTSIEGQRIIKTEGDEDTFLALARLIADHHPAPPSTAADAIRNTDNGASIKDVLLSGGATAAYWLARGSYGPPYGQELTGGI